MAAEFSTPPTLLVHCRRGIGSDDFGKGALTIVASDFGRNSCATKIRKTRFHQDRYKTELFSLSAGLSSATVQALASETNGSGKDERQRH